MEKLFVDSSGWVAFFVANDKNHEKAIKIFEDLKKSKMDVYTSDYIIDETITTILARGNHNQSVFAGEALFASEIIKIVYVGPNYFQKAWDLYKKYKDKEFSFTDVTSFIIMKSFNIGKAFSFDQEFEQAGFEVLK